MYTKQEENLIILSSFNELTYNQKKNLLHGLNRSEPDFAACERELIKSLPQGVYNKIKADFYSEKYRSAFFGELDKKGIKCVTYISENYPLSLKNIPDPPVNLFCKGNTDLLKTECFAVVGSRRCPAKTEADTKKIAYELAHIYTVVSGIADGGDTAAVEGALKKGKLICVIANGFDYAYPTVNRKLLAKVAKEALVITEYPPEVPPRSFQFPVRNRIIAGLARGVLVVSAAKRSGALITAKLAHEYNRDVFAFPYSVGVMAGEGCNSIIKQYAHLTENLLDILFQYGLDLELPKEEQLTGDELELYNALREEGEAFLPKVAEKLGQPVYKLMTVISKLELKGKVVRLGGNRFSAVK